MQGLKGRRSNQAIWTMAVCRRDPSTVLCIYGQAHALAGMHWGGSLGGPSCWRRRSAPPAGLPMPHSSQFLPFLCREVPHRAWDTVTINSSSPVAVNKMKCVSVESVYVIFHRCLLGRTELRLGPSQCFPCCKIYLPPALLGASTPRATAP